VTKTVGRKFSGWRLFVLPNGGASDATVGQRVSNIVYGGLFNLMTGVAVGLNRLNSGERISGASAILLYVFMSFDWFGSKDSGELRLFSVDRSAWEALDYISIVLLATTILTLATVTLRFADAVRRPALANAVVASLGGVSMLLILFRIVDPPNFGSFKEIWGTITIEGTVRFPVFLALSAAAGIAFGGFLAMSSYRRAGRPVQR
jgi:hypothetical protein